MTLEYLLDQYGYLLIFLGGFFEGESVLIVAGFLASREYFNIWFVILWAFLGDLTGHLVFYIVGRYQGKSLIFKSAAIRKHYPRAEQFIQKYGTLSVFLSQYIYGIRLISALAFGVLAFEFKRFVALEILASGLWALILGWLGFTFGEALEVLLGDLKRYERKIIVSLIVAGILYWLGYKIFLKMRERRGGD
ncbi:MAG: DedA family protein [Candidatus Tectomicrobia bacterium]|nr:DedA family protein [Candidatus Tectomicrobia bacterium]